MAEQKDDPGQAAKLAQSKKSSQASAAPDPLLGQERAAQDSTSSAADRLSATVVRRKQRYLIGFRWRPGMPQPPADPFLERLAQMEGVEIIRRLGADSAIDSAAPAQNGGPHAVASHDIAVALMDERRGEALRQNAPPHIIVEVDAPLRYSDMAVPEPMSWQHAVQAIPFPRPRREFRFRVLGKGDQPLPNAVVNLYGPGFPVQTITDSSGQASLQILAADGISIRAVHVRPSADHWERYIHNPSLDPAQTNVIRLSPLERTAGTIPGERPYGWGQRLMKFDRVADELNGAGTKIGIIDSGCDTSHAVLRHIVRGVDLTQRNDPQSWKLDELGQGTHCAGIIAASGAGASGVIGCAPAAEVHVFKVIPGGYFSDLILALDHCIERRLDIVQIGVSGEQFSELVAQRIAVARQNGIACIAAAGNSGGTVQFPGNVPGVVTVAAVGKLGEYPQDTRHAQRALPQLIPPSGVFATNFSCWGPQIAVCAPGVAVISSVPGGGYAAWDGSAMAASHVVGFSALLLSHHPLLQIINYAARADQRVSALSDLVRAAAIPYAQVDPNRVGAGLPDLQQVPGLLAMNAPFYGTAIGAGAALQAPFIPQGAYLGDPMNAILQMRAAGLWV
jgi:subtilisin